MLIGERLRVLRREKKMSQGQIEKATGLLRCYISRVENGATVPSVGTLEKFARALNVPMYALFYDGAKPPKPLVIGPTAKAWGSAKDANELNQFRRLLKRTKPRDQKLLLFMASKMSQKRRG